MLWQCIEYEIQHNDVILFNNKIHLRPNCCRSCHTVHQKVWFLFLTALRSSEVKSDCAKCQKYSLCPTSYLLPFQDISYQRIVTLNYDLSSFKVIQSEAHGHCIMSVGSNSVTVAILDIFHVKKLTLIFERSKSSMVKSDGTKWKPAGPTLSDPGGSTSYMSEFIDIFWVTILNPGA